MSAFAGAHDTKDNITYRGCAAEAIFCCPTENSRHLEAYLVSKDALFNNEKESARTMARCHVSLEKSSKNYIRCENELSQATCIASPLSHLPVKQLVLVAGFPRGEAKSTKKMRRENPPLQVANFRGEGGVICGLI